MPNHVERSEPKVVVVISAPRPPLTPSFRKRFGSKITDHTASEEMRGQGAHESAYLNQLWLSSRCGWRTPSSGLSPSLSCCRPAFRHLFRHPYVRGYV